MQLATNEKVPCCPESQIYNQLLNLDNSQILELGCGTAVMTREIASGGSHRNIIATEVDSVQHQKNLDVLIPDVKFIFAGAQEIPVEDNSVDYVLMFKSLHHVPAELLDTALREINRVLKPGGLAYISEPVYAGDFNELISLFHDEKEVREKAFSAIRRSIEEGLFSLRQQVFFDTVVEFEDFNAFDKQIIGVTHTRHQLSESVYQQVKDKFKENMGASGALFTAPMRVDLLEKPEI